jgi:acetyltransferase
VILTNGGGPSVNTADLVDLSRSLSLVEFSDATKEALRAVLPPMAAVGNPIDVIGDAGPDRYDHTLGTLVTLDDVDAIIALVTPQMMTDPKGIAEVLAAYHEKKPLIPVFMGGDTVAAGIAALKAHGLIGFDNPSDVVEALDALARNGIKKREDTPIERADGMPDHAPTTLTMVPMEEMRTLLDNYDMPLAGAFVRTEEELDSAAAGLGAGPYALKVISQQLVHKSDSKALILGIADTAALHEAWHTLTDRVHAELPDAALEGMLLQTMTSGVECIIGMKRDRTFGPVIVFGLGGIFVEILKDSALRIAPVSKDDALAQIREIKGLPLLTGARGQEPVDLDALAGIIASLSQFSLDYPEIQEIDFNPVFARPKGAAIVDARLMRRADDVH